MGCEFDPLRSLTLGALRCTESHSNNQCQIESPISAFWTAPLIILFALDTRTFTLRVFTPPPAWQEWCHVPPYTIWDAILLIAHGRYRYTLM